MSERILPEDMALLSTESASTPMHNATLEIFQPGERGFDYDDLLGLISDRIAFVPRYRQRLRFVPGRVANPAWVDDEDFDLTFHVRRSALPRPGSMEQLRDLVGRILPRRLDRSRPLWEMYLIEGLEDDRFAILAKSHQILVDGSATIDLGQVLLDTQETTPEHVHDGWLPAGGPSTAGLIVGAVADSIRDPRLAVQTVRENAESVVRGLNAVSRAVPLPLGRRRSAPESPVNATLSEQRRLVTVKTELAAYRRVREMHGGTVNDVVLATITGALRGWLMTRAESVHGSRTLRAMVPMSVIDEELEATSLGSQVAGHLLSLPIGESSPVVRLHQVSYALKAHKDTGRAVGAERIAGVVGFAPTTFHALGARVAAAEMRRGFHLVITNVPGPQFPLYASGAKMLESYPVPPLLPGHALAIGVTSYDGGVYFGLNGDRDAIPDLEVLGQCITEALDELVDTTGEGRARAPRGRKKVSAAKSTK